MLHNLLCTSSVITKHIAAAADLIGGVGTPMRGHCHPAAKVPLRIVHGEVDTVLSFDKAAEVDGSPFMSTRARLGRPFCMSCMCGLRGGVTQGASAAAGSERRQTALTAAPRAPRAGDAADMWRGLYGCGGDGDRPSWSDGVATSCASLCAAPGRLELCMMRGVGHQLDVPHKGYAFGIAWQWFMAHAK